MQLHLSPRKSWKVTRPSVVSTVKLGNTSPKFNGILVISEDCKAVEDREDSPDLIDFESVHVQLNSDLCPCGYYARAAAALSPTP